jgi:hypothetical protein
MRECANCHTQTEDHIVTCPTCHFDLNTDSVTARALQHLMASPRVSGIYIVSPTFACPVCRGLQGTYYKNSENIPTLPHEGCSCPNGCVCQFEPLSFEVGP